MMKKSFLTFQLLLLNRLVYCILIESIGRIIWFFLNHYNYTNFILPIVSGICIIFVLFWATFKYSSTGACCVKVVYVASKVSVESEGGRKFLPNHL